MDKKLWRSTLLLWVSAQEGALALFCPPLIVHSRALPVKFVGGVGIPSRLAFQALTGCFYTLKRSVPDLKVAPPRPVDFDLHVFSVRHCLFSSEQHQHQQHARGRVMPEVAKAAEELLREAEDLLRGAFVARRVVSIRSARMLCAANVHLAGFLVA